MRNYGGSVASSVGAKVDAASWSRATAISAQNRRYRQRAEEQPAGDGWLRGRHRLDVGLLRKRRYRRLTGCRRDGVGRPVGDGLLLPSMAEVMVDHVKSKVTRLLSRVIILYN